MFMTPPYILISSRAAWVFHDFYQCCYSEEMFIAGLYDEKQDKNEDSELFVRFNERRVWDYLEYVPKFILLTVMIF